MTNEVELPLTLSDGKFQIAKNVLTTFIAIIATIGGLIFTFGTILTHPMNISTFVGCLTPISATCIGIYLFGSYEKPGTITIGMQEFMLKKGSDVKAFPYKDILAIDRMFDSSIRGEEGLVIRMRGFSYNPPIKPTLYPRHYGLSALEIKGLVVEQAGKLGYTIS